MDPEAPNLEIRSLLQVTSSLSYSRPFQTIRNLIETLEESLDSAPPEIDDLFRNRRQTPKRLLSLLNLLRNQVFPVSAPAIRWERFSRCSRYVLRKVNELEERLSTARFSTSKDEPVGSELKRKHIRIRDLLSCLRDVNDFMGSEAFLALRRQALLLLGEWGTGKTHFLCDLTKHRCETDKPTLLFLAQRLHGADDPLEALCKQTGLARGIDELFSHLDELGREIRQRALLIVDGIDEGDRQAWEHSARRLASSLSGYPSTAVILSCRTPFDEQILPSKTSRTNWVVAHHDGFEQSEIDAQAAFFSYYDIPASHVPLLSPEFSRPLFLKTLCKTVHGLKYNKKSGYIHDLASGQRGMTRLLEDFVRTIGEDIEDDFGLERRTCWRILKNGFAPVMADRLEKSVSRPEAAKIIAACANTSTEKAEAVLDRMLTSGLLMERATWGDEANFRSAIGLPYERFSDHLIARHLLGKYLNTSSESTIRRSLYVDRPLGRVFELTHGNNSYARPGLATAIILEFPERVKRCSYLDDRRELAFYLPKKRQLLAPLEHPFIQGLIWRSLDSFCEQTDQLVGLFVEHSSSTRIFENLVATGTRPEHRYSSDYLWERLSSLDIPSRDLLWSEFIRLAGEQSVIYRLLEWLERRERGLLEPPLARCMCEILGLLLTTTRRGVRDRVTRALFKIGMQNTDELFEVTLKALSFGDPYVMERLLAASYGVAMECWADPTYDNIRSNIVSLARSLDAKMGHADAPCFTTHELTYEYMEGIRQLARRIDPNCKENLGKGDLDEVQLESPYPAPEMISDDTCQEAESALWTEYSDRTLGQLVRDRRSHEHDHPEYDRVKRQICWRITDLGYSKERFEEIDRLISRHNWHRPQRNNPYQTDTYGRKYLWIAFFEMWGYRKSKGLLPTHYEEERPPDCDIDPSFPPKPAPWEPDLPQVFSSPFTSREEWLFDGPAPSYSPLIEQSAVAGCEGPWILVQGYLRRRSDSDPRTITNFLRGLFVGPGQTNDLVARFHSRGYPGNHNIPNPRGSLYSYAGEIPWSPRFTPSLRDEDGTPLPDIRWAYSEGTGASGKTGVRIELPVCRHDWEMHHSHMNQVTGALVPTPHLCKKLGLVKQAQSWDLIDQEGRKSSLYRETTNQDGHHAKALFLRKDLLLHYLKEAGWGFLWLFWGERNFDYRSSFSPSDDIARKLRRHAHIHKEHVTPDSPELQDTW